jgi:hypothetical protein
MRILAAILGTVIVVVVAVAVFAMLNLRALISVHRDRLVARVEHVIGRPIVVGEVVPSWWPLGVRLRRVTIGEDPKFGAEPFLVADGVVMAVRAWPLVHGRIEAAGVVLDRPRLKLVRNEGGRWNVESLGEMPLADELDRGPAKTKERRRTPRVPLEWVVGVALSDVHDGIIVIDDGTRSLVLQHVRLRAEDVHLGSTAHMRLDAAVFASNRPDLHLDVRVPDLGQNDFAHAVFAARMELDAADLAVLDGWVRWPGFAVGRVGRVKVVADGTLERLRATIELDAADPALRVGGVAIGAVEPIAVRARVATERAAITIEEFGATLGALEVRGRGEARQEPWRLVLDLTSQPEGSAAIAIGETPIHVSALDGRATFDREGLALAPLRLRMDGAPLEVRGRVTGIDPPALDVRVDGRPFDGTFAADLTLDATGTARARVEVAGIDLAPAVARFAPELRGRIEGRASGAVVVTGRVAGGALAAGSLAGSGMLTVSNGRLRAVNLPDLVIDEIESVPLMPQLVSARTRARYAELFANPDTIIESASIPFTLGRGRLSTEHATLDNPAYQITGKGWIDEAQELRVNATVLLGATVSRTLRDDVRAAKYLAADDGRIMLPFVARGRLGHVWVEPDAKRLRSRGLTALLGQSVDGGEHAPGDEARPDRQPDASLEERVIERLERMLRP